MKRNPILISLSLIVLLICFSQFGCLKEIKVYRGFRYYSNNLFLTNSTPYILKVTNSYNRIVYVVYPEEKINITLWKGKGNINHGKGITVTVKARTGRGIALARRTYYCTTYGQKEFYWTVIRWDLYW